MAESLQVGFNEDPAQAGKAQTELHKKLLRGWIMKFRRETGSKELRAEGSSVDAENGNIKIVEGPWNKKFLDELEGFPNMKHDDVVDSFVGAHHVITGGKYDLRNLLKDL